MYHRLKNHSSCDVNVHRTIKKPQEHRTNISSLLEIINSAHRVDHNWDANQGRTAKFHHLMFHLSL